MIDSISTISSAISQMDSIQQSQDALSTTASSPNTLFWTMLNTIASPDAQQAMLALRSSQAGTASFQTGGPVVVQPISQLSADQYSSTAERDYWGPSACSAASLTMVLNAYGRNVHIGDIVHALGSNISPSEGLLNQSALMNVARSYGMNTQQGPSDLNGMLSIANSGTPVIVAVRGGPFPNGHFMVVTGSDANNVYVADSSGLHLKSLSISEFSALWEHNSIVVTPPLGSNSMVSSGAQQGIPANLQPIFASAASQYEVPASLLEGVAKAESGFNTNAVSPAGAQGVMQLMPGTAKGFGVTNSFDPTQNIFAGAKYLSNLLHEFGGNQTLALAAYNAGSGAVKRYGGVPPYPETQNYIQRVLQYAAQFGG